MNRCVIISLCVLLALLCTPAQANYTLSMLGASTYPDAVCLDGSQGGYYIELSPGSLNWQLYLEGGGWCYEEEDCLTRSTTVLGSSKNWPAAYPSLGGLLSPDCTVNPEFCNFNRIWFVYCDGNSFTGNRAQPINVNGTDLYWRGWSILNSILADLSVNPLTAKSWLAAEQVMVTGCSAGGLASILHGDYLLASLPSKSVKKQGIVPISGFFLDVPNVDGTPVYGDEIRGAFELANSTAALPPACIAANADQPWLCNFAQHAYPTIQNFVYLLNSLADLWQLECIATASPVPEDSPDNGHCSALWPDVTNCLSWESAMPTACNQTQVSTINNYIQEFLTILNNSSNVERAGNGGFLSSCITHCDAQSNSCFEKFAVDGVTVAQAVSAWWAALDGTPTGTFWTRDCETMPYSTNGSAEVCNQLCAYC